MEFVYEAWTRQQQLLVPGPTLLVTVTSALLHVTAKSSEHNEKKVTCGVGQ